MAPAASAAINTAPNFALKLLETMVATIELGRDFGLPRLAPQDAVRARMPTAEITDGVPNRGGLRQTIVKKG